MHACLCNYSTYKYSTEINHYQSNRRSNQSFNLLLQLTNQRYSNLLLKILKRAVSYKPSCPTIGGLYHEVKELNEGEFVLSKLVEKFGTDGVWDCIERALTSINFRDDEYPSIVNQTITCAPQYLNKVLMRFPDAFHERDEDNRLPINVALDNGIEWDNNLMIHVNQFHLKDRDPRSTLPLFALAAREPSCDLRTI